MKEKAVLKINGENISAIIEFPVSLEKYEIKLENLLQQAIKDEILLKTHFNYKQTTN